MPEIFVFRHGETDWNRERRYQGHTDVPLNASGRAQALELAQRMKALAPEIILTSDLVRARETATIVNSLLGLEIQSHKAFRELHMGDAEGLHRDVIVEKFGASLIESYSSVDPKDLDFMFPNGETKRQVLHRVTNGLKDFFLKNSNYKKVALSTHGGALRYLVHSCKLAPQEAVPLHNCVLYKIEFDLTKDEWIFRGSP